jgi:tetratricopeptide (TPR) repeat protein
MSPRARRDVVRDIQQAFENQHHDLALELTQELAAQSKENDAEAVALAVWASLRGGNDASDEELRAALPRLEHAVKMDRTSDIAVYYRGLLHKRLNNIQSAFRDFARAVQLNPDNLDAEREVRLFAMRVRKGSVRPPPPKQN